MLFKNPTFLASLTTLLLSVAALVFGVPTDDPGLQTIASQVASGVMGLSAAIAGVQALKKAKP